MNNQEKNSYVRAHILRALMELMQTRTLKTISVSELTEAAGVGRASFYRNFSSKEDVLKQESERLMNEWQKVLERQKITAPNEILISLLDFYKENAEFYMTLYRAGLSEIVRDTILRSADITPELPNAVAYVKSAVAYMIYGWVIEWLRRGMQESGTELALMIAEEQKRNSAQ